MLKSSFDSIIIGGSYAGLSAAMCLGRSLRTVLVIDNGKPCNVKTPHSHNFLTQDGETPANIAAKAKEQVLQYKTVQFFQGTAETAVKKDDSFEVSTNTGEQFTGRSLLLTSGVRDIMLPIPGFDECWGVSALHCPYCHGYEVHGQPLGILSNGEMAYEFAKMIHNWSTDLVVFTNGPNTIPTELNQRILDQGITICEKEIAKIAHENGKMTHVVFTDGSERPLNALFARAPYEQNTKIAETLGCAMTNMGFIQVDEFQKTTIPGVFAAGDCTTFYRAVSVAVAAGTKAGAFANKHLSEESFKARL